MVEYIEDSLDSRVLERVLSYRVLRLGADPSNRESLPVVYLLHGLFGDRSNWQELTRISSLEEVLPMTVVMPDGGNHWYSDAARSAGSAYETFFLEEFIPEIETRVGGNGNRAVAGLSMGGYGALKFALRRPDLFKFAASSSGAFNAVTLGAGDFQGQFRDLEDSILDVFGPAGSESRAVNDLFGLLETADPKALPPMHIECGTEDAFIESNRALVRKMASQSIRHTFSEMPGGHDWQFWAGSFERILNMASRHVGAD